jgi:hypothetical protein
MRQQFVVESVHQKSKKDHLNFDSLGTGNQRISGPDIAK